MWIFWAFNLSFVTDIWAFFWLREFLGYFLKNWAIFSPKLLVTLHTVP
jgi:hypothetical protein